MKWLIVQIFLDAFQILRYFNLNTRSLISTSLARFDLPGSNSVPS